MTKIDRMLDDLALGDESEGIERENMDCNRPGPRGCGRCPGCLDWGDYEYERRRDKQLEKELEKGKK